MPKPEWIIRAYEPGKFFKTVDITGSYRNIGARANDNITIFAGMYGSGDYMIWEMHNDMPFYDFSGIQFDVEIYAEGNTAVQAFREQYVPIEITFNGKEGKYHAYCVTVDENVLRTKLVDWKIDSLSYSENRTPAEVLKSVIVDKGIFQLAFYDIENKTLTNFEYRYLNVRKDWTVREFINYIADENGYEWFVRKGVLHIGKEILVNPEFNSSRPKKLEKDIMSAGAFFGKFAGDFRIFEKMSKIGDEKNIYRCVWLKHGVGEIGGVTRACYVPTGSGAVDKKLYYETLEGALERRNAAHLLKNKVTSHSVILGSILKDNSSTYVDKVSVQKSSKSKVTKTPRDSVFDRNSEDDKVKYIKENVCRTSPYIDTNAGLLFPAKQLTTDAPPPNSVVLNIEGREEASVIIADVLGNGEDISIPVKNNDDFRFQLPNGWCLYVKSDGSTILQIDEKSAQNLVEELDTNGTGLQFLNGTSKQFILQVDSKSFIEWLSGASGGMLISSEGDIEMSAPNITINVVSSGAGDFLITVGSTFGVDGNTVEITGSTQIVLAVGATTMTITAAGVNVT